MREPLKPEEIEINEISADELNKHAGIYLYLYNYDFLFNDFPIIHNERISCKNRLEKIIKDGLRDAVKKSVEINGRPDVDLLSVKSYGTHLGQFGIYHDHLLIYEYDINHDLAQGVINEDPDKWDVYSLNDIYKVFVYD